MQRSIDRGSGTGRIKRRWQAALGLHSGDKGGCGFSAFLAIARCCADHRGTPELAKATDAHLQGAAGIWRNAFIRMPMRANF
jgi:alkyldihydroxyacetonephosphate synthase